MCAFMVLKWLLVKIHVIWLEIWGIVMVFQWDVAKFYDCYSWVLIDV